MSARSGTSPKVLSTTAGANSPTFGSPVREKATAPPCLRAILGRADRGVGALAVLRFARHQIALLIREEWQGDVVGDVGHGGLRSRHDAAFAVYHADEAGARRLYQHQSCEGPAVRGCDRIVGCAPDASRGVARQHCAHDGHSRPAMRCSEADLQLVTIDSGPARNQPWLTVGRLAGPHVMVFLSMVSRLGPQGAQAYTRRR